MSKVPDFEDYIKTNPELSRVYNRVSSWGQHPASTRGYLDKRLRESERYLGEGVDKIAVRVGSLVLKVMHEKPLRSFESQVNPLVASLGVIGLEQLVTYSKDKNVIVTEFVAGKRPIDMTTSDLLKCVTPESVRRLSDALEKVRGKPVYYESVGRNVIISAETGITLIDPVDDPMIGTNFMGSITEGIATYVTSPDPRVELVPRPNREIDALMDKFYDAQAA